MLSRVREYILRHHLLQAGDRVGMAVSGGADSVALLRLLCGLKDDLGIVLTVVHFHHGIRGMEADADQQFVSALAKQTGLGDSIYLDSGNAPAYALSHKVSLETAAREMRDAFFRKLIQGKKLEKIATAHTMDDQAETVLMRLIRGAGTRGLAGIHPEHRDSQIIRPLLGLRRTEIESYLKSLSQDWREDASNRDPKHTRNRIRHELLPLLARDYNPGIVETLARSAEVSRSEDEYWEQQVKQLLPLVLLPGKPVRGGGRAVSTGSQPGTAGLSMDALLRQPPALRRRLLRAAAESLDIALDSEHVEEVLRLLVSGGKACNLPGGWLLRRSFRELRFEPPTNSPQQEANEKAGYSYSLPVPGSVLVTELNSVVHVRFITVSGESAGYNHVTVLNTADAQHLTVRNWRTGDCFRTSKSGSAKKVKEMLLAMKVPQQERQRWPVVTACVGEAENLVWVQGALSPELWVEMADGARRRLEISLAPDGDKDSK